MKIKSIDGIGKNVFAEYDIADITIFTGRNSVGKTGIFNLIELGLTDEIKELGARNQDIFKLANDDGHLNITIDFDNDRWVTRQFKMVKDTIKKELDFKGKTETSVSKIQQELNLWLRPSKYGIDIQLLPSMSTNERRKTLLNLIFNNVEDTIDTPFIEYIFDEIEDDGINDIVKELERYKSDNVYDYVASAETYITNAIKAIKEAMEPHNAVISACSLMSTVVSQEKLKELENELIETQNHIKLLHKELGDFEATNRIHADILRQAKESESILDTLAYDESKEDYLNTELTKLTDYIANLHDEIKEVLSEKASSIKEKERLNADICPILKEKCDRISSTAIQILSDMINQDVDKLNKQHQKLSADLNHAKEEKDEITDQLKVAIYNNKQYEKQNDRHKALKAQLDKIIVPQLDLDIINNTIELEESNIEKLKKDIEDLSIALDNSKRLAYAEMEINKLNGRKTLLENLKKAISEYKQLLLKEVVGTFIQDVNNGLQSINPDYEFWIEFENYKGTPDCEIGFRKHAVSRSFASASGSEQILIGTSLAIALMRRDKMASIRVLMLDNIQDLDKNNFNNLICTLQLAIDNNMIDNAILAGLTDVDIHEDNIYTYRLGEQK